MVNTGNVNIYLTDDPDLIKIGTNFWPNGINIRGQDLLIDNLNPRVISEDHRSLLGIIQEVQHLADAKYRKWSFTVF